MAEEINSLTKAREEIQRLDRKLERQRDRQQEQKDATTTVAAAVVSRIATRVLPSLFPGVAGIMPILTIGGAAYSATQAFDQNASNNALFLGTTIGLGIDVADKISDFALGTIAKFQGK